MHQFTLMGPSNIFNYFGGKSRNQVMNYKVISYDISGIRAKELLNHQSLPNFRYY